MTSARFSNLCKLSGVAFFMAALSGFFSPAIAQNDSGYTPPPMFDDMTPPMVRPQSDDGYIVVPKKSENTVLPPSMNAPQKPPIVLPRVSVDPDAPKPAPRPAPNPKTTAPVVPVAPAKPSVPVATQTPATQPSVAQPPAKPDMMKPMVEEVYIKREKPADQPKETVKTDSPAVADPVPPKKLVSPVKDRDQAPSATTVKKEPVAAEERTAPIPKPDTAQRDPKESVIQGPKTMPAIPAQDVDGQVLYENKAADNEPTILERQQQQSKKQEELKPIVPRPKDNVEPASFEKGEQGALKKSISFEAGQIALAEDETDKLAAGVVKELDNEDKKEWRVQIKSYATPHGTGLSSDRRIALSRALSLRSSLITQGVSASRIDVLAEGLQSEAGQPGDRIDLYLYGPQEE